MDDWPALRTRQDEVVTELKSYWLYYLATPYKKYPKGPEMAFRDAARLAARLFEQNIIAYSPIVHGHPLSIHGGIPPNDYSIWNSHNFKLAKACDFLLIGKLPSWEISEGIAHEIHLFKSESKRILYLNPDTMEVSDK